MKQLLKQLPVLPSVYRMIRDRYTAYRLQGAPAEAVFTDIFSKNYWRSRVSRSGRGSDDTQTRVIRESLPRLLRDLGVRSILDIPCGDFHWMKAVDLSGVMYIGADIVRPLIQRNQATFGAPGREFRHLNLITDSLPRVDLVFTRDCLVHLSFADALQALRNIADSGSTWLVATTFPERQRNRDIVTGDWRPLNLELEPFRFPAPRHLLIEGCSEERGAFADKALGAWRIADLELG